MASISSTKGVSSSSGSTSVRSGRYIGATEAGSFVDAIDTSNRVSVKTTLDDERKKQKQEQEGNLEEKEIATDLAYVRSAIEALAASGVYDEAEDVAEHVRQTTIRVNVYGANQTIINRDEEKDNQKTYKKEEFFIETTEEIDELV